ncbi:Protein of unknown function [Gryllus bimaculatus]|nr:Protein of unknown function [Gryllus bimaculatus]
MAVRFLMAPPDGVARRGSPFREDEDFHARCKVIPFGSQPPPRRSLACLPSYRTLLQGNCSQKRQLSTLHVCPEEGSSEAPTARRARAAERNHRPSYGLHGDGVGAAHERQRQRELQLRDDDGDEQRRRRQQQRRRVQHQRQGGRHRQHGGDALPLHVLASPGCNSAPNRSLR